MPPERDTGTTVWLIRHGESVSNAGGVTTDPAMIPLSPTGRRQAEMITRVFGAAPDLIVTSPFLRARQTAQATIERFPSTPVEQWPIEEFTYLGSLHGRRTTGAQRQPMVDAYWAAADPEHVNDEKSESFHGVLTRAHRFLTTLSRRDPGHVAAFTHGLFTRVVLWAVLTRETDPTPQSMREFHRFRTVYLIPNCSIITLHLHPDRDPHIAATTTHLPADLHTGGY